MGGGGESGELHALADLSPEKELPVPIEYEARWAPQTAWILRREKCLAPAGNRIAFVQAEASNCTALRPVPFGFCNRTRPTHLIPSVLSEYVQSYSFSLCVWLVNTEWERIWKEQVVI
jgi:hypothetical protein